MKIVVIALMALVLAGCSTTRTTTPIVVQAPIAHPAKPKQIYCPPFDITKQDEQSYRIDNKSHENLQYCLSDTLRYVDQAIGIIDFYRAQ